MIQLNLLPDVKLQYIRARQRKRMVVGSSIIVSAFFLTIFIILFGYVRFVQTQHIKNLSDDIAISTQDLKAKQDLNKILTIQNQLNSLPGLHDQKVVSSRLFDYLNQLTPAKATISDVETNFGENKLVVKGNADVIGTVNKFADTLKFTTFTTKELDAAGVPVPEENKVCALGKIEQETPNANNQQTICRAFSEVVLFEYDLGSETTEDSKKPITYNIEFKFDPRIFANFNSGTEKAITLNVPNIISTRSSTEKPGALFETPPDPKPRTEGGE